MDPAATNWTRQTFAPLPKPGVDMHTVELPVVYISMSLARPRFAFESIHQFRKKYETELSPDRRGNRRKKQAINVPDFNHFVLLLPPGDARERQVKLGICMGRNL